MEIDKKITWVQVWNSLDIKEEPHEILIKLKEGK
jgi:hypothetical protein